MSGKGTLTDPSGNKYVGDFANDEKKHGKGKEIWMNGDNFVGEF